VSFLQNIAMKKERNIYQRFGKLNFDLFFASLSIAILGLPMVILAVIIRIKIGKPIFFKQERPGLYGKIYSVYKFRTMTNNKDKDGNLLPDKERLTDLGRLLRSTSLDELPEFLNVIKGDMSIVGPRPLLTEYLNRYTPEQARRHELRPGITGWAQVNGRNAISWEEKFNLDVWYVNNLSIWLDIKIIGMTIWKILKREGISQKGHATMEEFKGYQK
jgi:sugar transferase EpsL